MTDSKSDIYSKLAAPFEWTFMDTSRGVPLEYITGEQCISRLNEVLGAGFWTFEIPEHGYIEDTDEEWSKGRLTANINGVIVVKEQFGSQKRNKKRSGEHIEIGFDMKGAGTDAMKKCASLLGVGLYLSHKKPDAQKIKLRVPACAECDATLKEATLPDGTVWSIEQLVEFGVNRHGKALCYSCCQIANEKLRAAAQTRSGDKKEFPG